jgi:hypothetical protein
VDGMELWHLALVSGEGSEGRDGTSGTIDDEISHVAFEVANSNSDLSIHSLL